MVHRLRLATIVLGCLSAGPASAQVAALGASNTAGWGVSASDSYPSQLEAMLRAEGLNVRVSNHGIPGDTTDGMLSRLDAATPDGTRVVILQPGSNDMRMGRGDGAANVAAMAARLKGRGIAVLVIGAPEQVAAGSRAGAEACRDILGGVPASEIKADGIHLTPAGYRAVAAALAPCIQRILERP